jgi:hypothetical protein
MRIGDSIKTVIFGREVTVKIIAMHPLGVIDVETPAGACYRLAGLGPYIPKY